MISPVFSRIFSSRPRSLRLLQYPEVRRSCHTMALQMGRPVAASHTMVVSRWLAMPSATMGPSFTSATAFSITWRIEDQISMGFCSTHPCRGKSWVNSCWCMTTCFPSWSKMMALELLVPWSRDKM